MYLESPDSLNFYILNFYILLFAGDENVFIIIFILYSVLTSTPKTN